jgi:hypothetical protein
MEQPGGGADAVRRRAKEAPDLGLTTAVERLDLPGCRGDKSFGGERTLRTQANDPAVRPVSNRARRLRHRRACHKSLISVPPQRPGGHFTIQHQHETGVSPAAVLWNFSQAQTNMPPETSSRCPLTRRLSSESNEVIIGPTSSATP